MGRLLGRGQSKPDNELTRKNEIVAEIKKEHPYIGPVALQQEVMKRMAQHESDNNHQNGSTVATAANTKEDFAPQRILFKRNKPKNRQRQKSSETTTSLTQSINKSFIEFLSSSTNSHNTVKTSNVVGGETAVIPGRRTSTHAQGEDDAYVHMAAQQMRDMELSDYSEEEDDEAGGSGSSNRRSSAGSSSLREKMRKRFSSKAKRHRRTSSANSSISTNSAQDNNSSDNDSTKPRHKSEEQNNDNSNNSIQKIEGEGEEKEIMDFVHKFLADGGSVNPKPRATESRRSSYTNRRRSSLCSVEESKVLVTSGESVNRSITSLFSKCSTSDTNSRAGGDDSLICSWGRRSLNDAELVGGDGELICNWDSRQSVLSNTSSTAPTSDAVLCSNVVIATDEPTFPREINVGNKGDINS
jgi:hypothetical protein